MNFIHRLGAIVAGLLIVASLVGFVHLQAPAEEAVGAEPSAASVEADADRKACRSWLVSEGRRAGQSAVRSLREFVSLFAEDSLGILRAHEIMTWEGFDAQVARLRRDLGQLAVTPDLPVESFDAFVRPVRALEPMDRGLLSHNLDANAIPDQVAELERSLAALNALCADRV